MSNLQRFVTAHETGRDGATFAAAMLDLNAHRKKTKHYSWYVFPQLKGVAAAYTRYPSATTIKFEITDNKGAINLAPFLILSANSPQITLFPDIKIDEGSYPKKLEEKLHSLIHNNINNNNYKILVDKYLRIDPDKITIDGTEIIIVVIWKNELIP